MLSSETYERHFDEDVQDPDCSTCPECDGRVQTNTRETVCTDCGLVIQDQPIDPGPEWRWVDDCEGHRERTGAPLTEARHDRGLSTDIGRNTDGNGNTLDQRKRRQLNRLRREHSRARFGTKADRNLAHGCTEIRRIVSSLGLGDSAREQASSMFRTAQAEGLLPGRSIEGMAAGSVFAICRCRGLARGSDEVGAVAQVDEHKVLVCYRVLNRELGLPAATQQPADFVPRLASECTAPEHVERRALELARRCADAGFVNGCQPSGVAGACLYRAAREQGWDITQPEIAERADSTCVTIRARLYELEDLIDE